MPAWTLPALGQTFFPVLPQTKSDAMRVHAPPHCDHSRVPVLWLTPGSHSHRRDGGNFGVLETHFPNFLGAPVCGPRYTAHIGDGVFRRPPLDPGITTQSDF